MTAYQHDSLGNVNRSDYYDDTWKTFSYDKNGLLKETANDHVTNTILHEYDSQSDSDRFENLVRNSKQTDADITDNLVTWVFNDGFVPSAKITSEGHYSIISDYLGTPVEAYDEQGNRVWSAELDIYGRVKEFSGEQDFIPFRYQGQYDDIEIGLYYNRFRYYSPEEGIYTQQDPIGLAGGNPTLYGYVSKPFLELDPFGLNSTILNKNIGGIKGDSMEAHHLIPEEIWKKHSTMFDQLGMNMDGRSNGILMPNCFLQAESAEDCSGKYIGLQLGN